MTTLSKFAQMFMRLSGAGLVALALTSGLTAQQAQVAPKAKTASAPEIDVALAGGAVALVLGGVLLATAVRRKRLARS